MAKFPIAEYSFIGPYNPTPETSRVEVLSHRYWIFASERYYPSGGLYDFRGSADTVEEAQEMVNLLIEEMTYCEWHVYDSETGKTAEGEDA